MIRASPTTGIAATRRTRVYGDRDRDDHEPRDSLIHDLDLPRGEERELVPGRDRVYELNGDDSRTLAASRTASARKESGGWSRLGPPPPVDSMGANAEFSPPAASRRAAASVKAYPTNCRKWRLANSLPEPVFRYRSNAIAGASSSNSITTSVLHGR
jgi:hypothetical protein